MPSPCLTNAGSARERVPRGRRESQREVFDNASRSGRHDEHAVREEHGLLDAVTDEENRVAARRRHALQIETDVLAGQRVERSEPLVHQ
jgi:predicted ATPase